MSVWDDACCAPLGSSVSPPARASLAASRRTPKRRTLRGTRWSRARSTGACAAAKVGPRHLLVGARCVASQKDKLAAGAKIEWTPALAPKAPDPPPPPPPEDADVSDAGSDADTTSDAAAPLQQPAALTAREGIIASVHIHESYTSKCTTEEACKAGTIGASNASDIAVIVLKDEIAAIPTIPVDLDVVNDADSLLIPSHACARIDGQPAGLEVTRAIAMPARAVNHDGSPYQTSKQLSTRVKDRYVVTAGRSWQKEAPGLCRSDIGMPIFRSSVAAVAGISSTYTTSDTAALLTVTVQHTRVDEKLGYRIGTWLKPLGVQTVHSCSEAEGGCTKKTYDGPMPKGTTGGTTGPVEGGDSGTVTPGDSGTKDDGGILPPDGKPNGPREEYLPDDEDDYRDGDDDDSDYADAAVPRKKKKKQESGCAAAPGSVAAGGTPLALGLLLAMAVIRRRRRSSTVSRG
jgi:hypothetical protein